MQTKTWTQRTMAAVLAIGFACPAAAQPASCLVLPLQPGRGVTAYSANRLTVSLAGALKSTGIYRVRTLPASRTSDGAAASTDAAVAAARPLEADRVIWGTLDFAAGKYVLLTTLCDTASGSVIRSVRTRYSSRMRNWAALAASDNICLLLNIQSEQPFPTDTTLAGQPVPAAAPAPPPAADDGPGRPPHAFAPWKAQVVATAGQVKQAVTPWIENRLEIGTRYVSSSLHTTHREPFLGTINRLDDNQSEGPFNLFADYYLAPHWGIELFHDRMQAMTITKDDGHSDGDFVISGPALLVFGRGRLDRLVNGLQAYFPAHWPRWQPPPWLARIRPHAGLGLAFYSSSFRAETWWYYGHSSKANWIEVGSPTTYRHGHRRRMDVEDTVGRILRLGADIEVRGAWLATIDWQTISADVDTVFYLDQQFKEAASIPMGHSSFLLGVKYAF